MRARQRGSVSIEYAVTILPFFVLLLAVIEVCRFMMLSSMITVSFASATRDLTVSHSREDIRSKLEIALQENELPLLDSGAIKVQARYFASLNELADDLALENYISQPFAEFSLIYPYQLLFIPAWSDEFLRLAEFNRTRLVILERSANYVN